MLKMLINKSAAHNVETADDGLEAVTVVLASPEKYDVIFMDNFMPNMVTMPWWINRTGVRDSLSVTIVLTDWN